MAREGGSGATGRRGSRSLSAPTAHPEAGPRRGLPEPPPGFAPPSESLPVPGDSPRSGQPDVRSLLRRWQKLPCGSHGPGLRPSSGPDLTWPIAKDAAPRHFVALTQARYGTALQMDSLWNRWFRRQRLHAPEVAPARFGARFPSHWFHGIVRNLEGCAVPHRSIRE